MPRFFYRDHCCDFRITRALVAQLYGTTNTICFGDWTTSDNNSWWKTEGLTTCLKKKGKHCRLFSCLSLSLFLSHSFSLQLFVSLSLPLTLSQTIEFQQQHVLFVWDIKREMVCVRACALVGVRREAAEQVCVCFREREREWDRRQRKVLHTDGHLATKPSKIGLLSRVIVTTINTILMTEPKRRLDT